jgi:SET domain-containing protein
MLLCRQSDIIEVRRIDHRGKGGRGVFAVRDIAAATVIERVPVLLIPKSQVFAASPDRPSPSPAISWYVFDWAGATKREYAALALGYGSIYNHSYTPNARYLKEPPDVMSFVAIRDIAAGEEITINYHGEPDDPRPVDFEVVD